MLAPGKVIGYKIGDRVYAPEDVVIIRDEEESLIEAENQNLAPAARASILNVTQELVMSVSRVDICTFDHLDNELSRKRYSAIPGDRIKHDGQAGKGTRWYVAMCYDPGDREIYRSYYSASEGCTFTYLVPTANRVRFN